MFIIDNGKLIKYTGKNKVVEIPSIVEIIGEEAFLGNSYIEEIYGPSVVEIEEKAFDGCSNLRKISFPNLSFMDSIIISDSLKELELGYDSYNCLIDSKIECVRIGDSHYVSSKDLLKNLSCILKHSHVRPEDKNPNVILKSHDICKFKLCGDASDLLDGIVTMEDLLLDVPEVIKNIVYDYGYKIYLIDSELIYLNEPIAGFTYYPGKLIVVDQEHTQTALIHEIGHSLDDVMKLSMRNDFLKLYSLEKENINKYNDFKILDGTLEHFKSSPYEFFAESFQSTILFEDSFSKECPKTHEYFNQLFADLNSGKIKLKKGVK